MRLTIGGLLLLASGCGVAEGASDRFVMDSTDTGIVRVTSDAPSGWRDSSRAWRLDAVQVYAGEEGTDGALVNPQSLAVDEAGRVYVADQKPAVIKVFGSDGRFIRTVGHEGKGPGEFTVAFLAIRKDRLVVHDPQTARTTVFDTAGTYLTSWNSACCYWTQVAVDTAGLIYVPSPDFRRPPDGGQRTRTPWVRYSLDGRVVDTLYVPTRESGKTWTITAGERGKEMVMQLAVPFTPTLSVALNPEGGFVLGWPERYEFAWSPGGADTTLIARRSWTPEPIPDPMRSAEIENRIKQASDGGRQFDATGLRSIFKLGDIPTQAPAYVSLEVDQLGNVWARQLLGSDSTRTTWDVFDRRGVWMGPVSVAAAVPEWGAVWFGAEAIYAGGEDDLGRPVITKYQLER